jgi:glyoxylase-like metal-dependent hydrolase (beta-lactamase superfamily II)
VDTKNPTPENIYTDLITQIKAVSPASVKYVINTQHHPDHVGNNQKFIDGGAQVVALEALKTFMGSDPRTTGNSRTPYTDVREGSGVKTRRRRGATPLLRPWAHR